MATHCSILAWRIPWTEEPGGLQSVRLQELGQDWCLFAAYNAVSEFQGVPGFPASDLSGRERKFTSLQRTPEPRGLTRMC